MLLTTMKKSYEAQQAVLVAEVNFYVNDIVGIGEHIDYQEAIETKLRAISELKDKIEAINLILSK